MKVTNDARDRLSLNKNIKTSHYLLNRKRSLSKTVASPSFSLPTDVKKALTEVKQQHEQQHRTVGLFSSKKHKKSTTVKRLILEPIENKATPWGDKSLGRKERLQLWMSAAGKTPSSINSVQRCKVAESHHKADVTQKQLNFLTNKDSETQSFIEKNHTTNTKKSEVVEQNSNTDAEKNTPERKVHFEEFSPVSFESSKINFCILESSAFKRRLKGQLCNKVLTPVRRSIRLPNTAIPEHLRDDKRIIESPTEVKGDILDGKIAFMPNKNLRTPLNKGWHTLDENITDLSFLS